MKKVLSIVSFLMLFSFFAKAQQTPRVDVRQQNQKERVQQGVVSGELTRAETAHAVQDQRHIRRAERRAKADGTVTKRERARLHHKQNRASRELKRDKHDRQDRVSANE